MYFIYRAKSKQTNQFIYGYIIQEEKDRLFLNSSEIYPETLSANTGLVDVCGTSIFENDEVIPIYVDPMGNWRENELSVDGQGVVKYDHGTFKIYNSVYNVGTWTLLNDYIERTPDKHISNYGTVYKEKNNVALVKIIEDRK